MKLHLKALAGIRVNPLAVDPLVLFVTPEILEGNHLETVIFQTSDVGPGALRVAGFLVLERVADRVREIRKSFLRRTTILFNGFSDLFLGAVAVFQAMLEADQAAIGIAALYLMQRGGDLVLLPLSDLVTLLVELFVAGPVGRPALPGGPLALILLPHPARPPGYLIPRLSVGSPFGCRSRVSRYTGLGTRCFRSADPQVFVVLLAGARLAPDAAMPIGRLATVTRSVGAVGRALGRLVSVIGTVDTHETFSSPGSYQIAQRELRLTIGNVAGLHPDRWRFPRRAPGRFLVQERAPLLPGQVPLDEGEHLAFFVHQVIEHDCQGVLDRCRQLASRTRLLYLAAAPGSKKASPTIGTGRDLRGAEGI